MEAAANSLVGTEKSRGLAAFNNASKKFDAIEKKQGELESEIRRRELFSNSASGGDQQRNPFAGGDASATARVQSDSDRDLLQQTMQTVERSDQHLADVSVLF